MVKKIIKRALRVLSRQVSGEFVEYTPEQKQRRELNPGLDYRKLCLEEALIMPSGEIWLDEAFALAEQVRKLEGDGPIIEVGTLFGWSTRVILLSKPREQKMISVDNYCWNPFGFSPDEHFRITRQTLHDAAQKMSLEVLRIDKDDFYRSFNGPRPALIFLDADHSYEATKADILWAKGTGAEVICGHDYEKDDFPGVVKAVDESGGPRILVDRFWVL